MWRFGHARPPARLVRFAHTCHRHVVQNCKSHPFPIMKGEGYLKPPRACILCGRAVSFLRKFQYASAAFRLFLLRARDHAAASSPQPPLKAVRARSPQTATSLRCGSSSRKNLLCNFFGIPLFLCLAACRNLLTPFLRLRRRRGIAYRRKAQRIVPRSLRVGAFRTRFSAIRPP